MRVFADTDELRDMGRELRALAGQIQTASARAHRALTGPGLPAGQAVHYFGIAHRVHSELHTVALILGMQGSAIVD